MLRDNCHHNQPTNHHEPSSSHQTCRSRWTHRHGVVRWPHVHLINKQSTLHTKTNKINNRTIIQKLKTHDTLYARHISNNKYCRQIASSSFIGLYFTVQCKMHNFHFYAVTPLCYHYDNYQLQVSPLVRGFFNYCTKHLRSKAENKHHRNGVSLVTDDY